MPTKQQRKTARRKKAQAARRVDNRADVESRASFRRPVPFDEIGVITMAAMTIAAGIEAREDIRILAKLNP